MKKLVFFVLPIVILFCTKCKKENTEEVPDPNQETILGIDMSDGRSIKTVNLTTGQINSFLGPDTAIGLSGRHIGYAINKKDSRYILISDSKVYIINYKTKTVEDSFPLDLRVEKMFYSENSGIIYGINISETDSFVNVVSIDLKFKTYHSVTSRIKVSDANTLGMIEDLTAFNSTTDDLYLVNKDSLLIINSANASIEKSIPLPFNDFMQITYNKSNGLIYGLSVGTGCMIQFTKFNPADNTFQNKLLSQDIRAFNRNCATLTNNSIYIFGRGQDYTSLVFVDDNGKIIKEIVDDIHCLVTY